MGIRTASLRSRVPQNLKNLLESEEKRNYELTVVYLLELEHGLMGQFPAMFRGTRHPVLTPNLELLAKVWRLLPPRRAKVNQGLFYINNVLGVGYPVLGSSEYDQEDSKPHELLTEREFEALVKTSGAEAFEWAPGLIGNDMSREEFIRTLEAARAQAQMGPTA